MQSATLEIVLKTIIFVRLRTEGIFANQVVNDLF